MAISFNIQVHGNYGSLIGIKFAAGNTAFLITVLLLKFYCSI